MKRQWTIVIGLILLAVLLGTAGLVQAQGPLPAGPEAVAPGAFPVQGLLTNASGQRLNGTFDITFRLYEVESGGTAICSDTRAVVVQNGLFNDVVDHCYNNIIGQRLWLGIQVESDPEMTPRQVLFPVPYAISLSPGAFVSGTQSYLLGLENWSATGYGLRASSHASGGYGAYIYNNGGGTGLWTWSQGGSALLACRTANSADCAAQNESGAAVSAYGSGWSIGVMGKGGTGLLGTSTQQLGSGVYAGNEANGTAIMGVSNSPGGTHNVPTLYLVQQDATGDYVVGANDVRSTGRTWRVDRSGKGYFNGGVQNSGADFAEQLPAQGETAAYEPGDVLVISPSADKTVALSTQPFATTVIGVYSTQPAVLAGAPDGDDPLSGVPVAMVGVVPCKVSAENGPIQRGDLLVSSGTPGHAMRAGPNPPPGTVLGKALQSWSEGTGVITILVTLQ